MFVFDISIYSDDEDDDAVDGGNITPVNKTLQTIQKL